MGAACAKRKQLRLITWNNSGKYIYVLIRFPQSNVNYFPLNSRNTDKSHEKYGRNAQADPKHMWIYKAKRRLFFLPRKSWLSAPKAILGFFPRSLESCSFWRLFRLAASLAFLRTVPTNGKYFFPDNGYVRQVDHISSYWNPKRKLGVTAHFSEITASNIIWGKTLNRHFLEKW